MKNAPKKERKKKLSIQNSMELKTDSLNLIRNEPKKKYIDKIKLFSIITLDIDGNVNKYENSCEEKLFNIYDIKEIEQDHKDKGLFNMGYVYFVKSYSNFFCITTDYGCYVIKKIE